MGAFRVPTITNRCSMSYEPDALTKINKRNARIGDAVCYTLGGAAIALLIAIVVLWR